jgi:hypothetical protein
LVILDFQLQDQDCSLLLDIVRRKWVAPHTKVVVLTGAPASPGLAEVAAIVPVLRKPLTDTKFEILLDVLAGIRGLPEAGYLDG